MHLEPAVCAHCGRAVDVMIPAPAFCGTGCADDAIDGSNIFDEIERAREEAEEPHDTDDLLRRVDEEREYRTYKYRSDYWKAVEAIQAKERIERQREEAKLAAERHKNFEQEIRAHAKQKEQEARDREKRQREVERSFSQQASARRSEEREQRRAAERRAKETEKQFAEQHKRLQRQMQRHMEEQKNAPISPVFPYDMMYEHTHLLGGSGTGKTTVLETMILRHLMQKDPPGLVVIDPKGLMVKRLSKLALFDPETGPLRNRLVLVDATQKPYPALNLFKDTSTNEEQRDLLFSQAVSTFRYIFSSGGFKFTSKQLNCFGYCVALMFEMGGTIRDLQALLRADGETKTSVSQAISRLHPDHQAFFQNDFSSKTYASTRDEINTRLNELALIPSFRGMFDQASRKVDMFDCIQNRKIVLVNTGIEKSRITSQMIGRLFISMLLNATYVRATLPESQHFPCFCFVDEFQEYIDEEKTPEFLRLSREYKVGVTLAHHNMYGAELSDALRVVISGSTRIKFAAAPKGMDLPYMARDYGVEPEYFAQHLKTQDHATFVCYAPGFCGPAPVHFPWKPLSKQPQMPDASWKLMTSLKQSQLSEPKLLPPQIVTPTPKADPTPPPAPDPDDENNSW